MEEEIRIFKPGEHCRIRSNMEIEGYNADSWGTEVVVQQEFWEAKCFYARTLDGKVEYVLVPEEVEDVPAPISSTEATEIQQQVARILQL